ncbi:MAG: hypothetical protein Q9204_003210 [Flavoplaca sp. TL-2023a]
MSSAPPLSFPTLIHALTRRKLDHRFFLPSIQPPSSPIFFITLTERLSAIESALTASPPFLPPSVLDNITATLSQMQTEAVELGRDIEMNPMRTIKGMESAKSEENLDTRRKESYDKWMGVLDGVWEEILGKSERRLHKGTLAPVLEGKRAERVEGGELVWGDRGEGLRGGKEGGISKGRY